MGVGLTLGAGLVAEGVPEQAPTRTRINGQASSLAPTAHMFVHDMQWWQQQHTRASMYLKRFGDRFQVRLESGERVVESLVDWLKAEQIGYAAVSGLGGVRQATVSYWNAESKLYETHQLDEQMEVVSLVGNVTIREGSPFLHAHVGLGRRDLSMIGGHLNDAVVHPLLELWLQREAEAVHRALDESCGLFVMQLPEWP